MLQLQNIAVTTDDGKEILKDLSLTVGDNRFVAITGPNGGGKSTLGRVVMGIVKPTGGRVIWSATQNRKAAKQPGSMKRWAAKTCFREPIFSFDTKAPKGLSILCCKGLRGEREGISERSEVIPPLSKKFRLARPRGERNRNGFIHGFHQDFVSLEER